ncbi:MFS transporter [bacterium]|nr:MFS transporter [bacterium]
MPNHENEGEKQLHLPQSVKVVGWASFLNDTASEMIYPLLPHFLLTALGGNRFWLGVIEGIADSVASLLKLWSGREADRRGRRKGLIIFGYGVPAVVRPLIAIVTAPWQLFLIRVTDRIGKGIRSSPRDALIADSTHIASRGQAFGFQRAMDNLGAAVGPMLAALFLWFRPEDVRTLFLLSIIPGGFVLALLMAGLRESESPANGEDTAPVPLTYNRRFRIYLLALLIFTVGNSSDAFLLARADELGVVPLLLPLLWCLCHIAKSTGNILLGGVIDKIGSRLSLLIGWLSFAAIFLAFGIIVETWHVWICFVGYGLVFGLIEPAERAMVAHLVGAQRKGLAYGWFNFAVGIATLPASLIFGALYQYGGALIAFGWGAGLALISAVLLMAIKPGLSSASN